MRGRSPPRGCRLLLLAGVLGLFAARSGWAAEPPAPQPASAAVALPRLGSQFLAERDQAVLDLIRLLPGSRDAVLEAFPTADRATRPLLVRVLAADGSKASIDALLRALPATDDSATAMAIEQSLVDHAEEVGPVVKAWRDPSGRLPPRIAELAALLQRARIESLFLSRKSKSGGTGSYPGQFDVLRADRKDAIEICLAILTDRAFKLPGTFLPLGAYQWLRAPPFVVERSELRGMAVNAIAELATAGDAGVIERLEGYHDALEREIALEERRADLRRRLFFGGNAAIVQKALLDSVIATLARLRPDPWHDRAVERIAELEREFSQTDDAAALALRLGDYGRAERLYFKLRRSGETALASYNLACAYARWALEIERGGGAKSDRSPADLRGRALTALETAVDAGYPDWEWMTQDRDLDPIHDDPRFAVLVERMKAPFRLKPMPQDPSAVPIAPGMR